MFHSAARGRVSSSRKHRSNGFFMGRLDGPSIINTTTPPLYQTQDKTALYSIIHLAAAGCSFPRSLSAPAWFNSVFQHIILSSLRVLFCILIYRSSHSIPFHPIPSRQPSIHGVLLPHHRRGRRRRRRGLQQLRVGLDNVPCLAHAYAWPRR